MPCPKCKGVLVFDYDGGFCYQCSDYFLNNKPKLITNFSNYKTSEPTYRWDATKGGYRKI